jgi:hypothetical protein
VGWAVIVAINALLSVLVLTIVVAPSLCLVFSWVTWYGAVEWFPVFSLTTRTARMRHQVGGIILSLRQVSGSGGQARPSEGSTCRGLRQSDRTIPPMMPYAML